MKNVPALVSLAIVMTIGAGCGSKAAPAPIPPAEPPAQAAVAPVAPIPEGWFALTPQIVVEDVDAAIDFCTAAFDAQPLFSMPGPHGSTMHAELRIGDSILMIDGEDAGLKSPLSLGGTPATLMVYVPNVDEIFERAQAAGAEVLLPLADQFWGDRYGQLTDPSGHRWAVATHVEDLTDEQMQQRADLAMAETAAANAKPAKKSKNKPKAPSWTSVTGTPAQRPVPSDYHTLTLAITTDDAAAAIAFYEKAFGATSLNRMPMPDGRLMHAEVQLGDARLMLTDEFPEMGSKSAAAFGGSPVLIHHYVEDADATFGRALDAGAIEVLPLADVFWGDRYGTVADPSGFTWGIATRIEDVSPEEITARMKAQVTLKGL